MIDLTGEATLLAELRLEVSLGDALPVNWQQQIHDAKESLFLPVEFVLDILRRCIDVEPSCPHFETISFIELTLWKEKFSGNSFLPSEPLMANGNVEISLI